MNKPEKTKEEEQRLRTLRALNILDTSPEERFDRITRMAKRIFDVPIALVSLVDEDRQWFKSSIGFNVSETPRNISFCSHAIQGDGMFIIPDAAKDERFADNPMVINEPHIRFYAGCPLRYVDGSKIGTLCIIDIKPRHFDYKDIQALKDLATTAERELTAVQLATQDDLTNTYNRRGFVLLASHILNICVRQGIPASLAFLDLDNFKEINDRYGHAEGDKVLISFADQITKVCRDADLFARLGGDEFAILFVNIRKAAADNIFSRFRRILEHYNLESGKEYDISFSYGIVDFNPDKHKSIESLLDDGDAQMYKWKKKNKLAKQHHD